MVKHYQRLMGMDLWELTCIFGKLSENPSDQPSSAGCSADPEYCTAVLYFDLERMKLTDDQPDACVRHELLHCFLWSLAALAEDWAGDDPGRKKFVKYLEEHATTMLERMPVWSVVKQRPRHPPLPEGRTK